MSGQPNVVAWPRYCRACVGIIKRGVNHDCLLKESPVHDERRTAFLYPRPDGTHWFPTIVETLEAERDRAIRQRDHAREIAERLHDCQYGTVAGITPDPDDSWVP